VWVVWEKCGKTVTRIVWKNVEKNIVKKVWKKCGKQYNEKSMENNNMGNILENCEKICGKE
jgi:hypothetical protein